MTGCLPVKDMPSELREAAIERGYDPTHEMTFSEALAEWAAWEIGDSAWAATMLDLQDQFATDLKNQS